MKIKNKLYYFFWRKK